MVFFLANIIGNGDRFVKRFFSMAAGISIKTIPLGDISAIILPPSDARREKHAFPACLSVLVWWTLGIRTPGPALAERVLSR